MGGGGGGRGGGVVEGVGGREGWGGRGWGGGGVRGGIKFGFLDGPQTPNLIYQPSIHNIKALCT